MYSTVSISKHDGASHRDFFFLSEMALLYSREKKKKYLPLSVFTVTS